MQLIKLSSSSAISSHTPPSLEFLIHTLKILQETLESKHTQPGIQTTRRRPNAMHAQLRDPAVNCPNTRCRAQHGSHGTSTPAIIPNLEDLQLRIRHANADIAVDAALQDSGRHGVGRHVGV